jgi:hypothetical protein
MRRLKASQLIISIGQGTKSAKNDSVPKNTHTTKFANHYSFLATIYTVMGANRQS